MEIVRLTVRQTGREFNYRGHSYPLWIVGVSGPIFGTDKACRLLTYMDKQNLKKSMEPIFYLDRIGSGACERGCILGIGILVGIHDVNEMLKFQC